MQLLIVIVNYRTAGLAIDCLISLAREMTAIDAKVVVVEADSGDGSEGVIREAIEANMWSSWCELQTLDRNGGFAFGNNLAISVLPELPPYVMLLNPDTVVRAGAVRALVEFMDANERVGIAGSRLEDPDGTPQRSAFRFPSVLSELEGGLRFGPASRLMERWVVAPPVPDHACAVDWVAGASMIIRREVFADIGVLDEQYFMYFEEVDFCLRASRAGWTCKYVPESRVVHLVGQSSGVTTKTDRPKRRPAYWFESRRRYFVKNHGRFYAAIADVAWTMGFTIWRFRRAIQRKPDRDPPKLLRDFILNSSILNRY